MPSSKQQASQAKAPASILGRCVPSLLRLKGLKEKLAGFPPWIYMELNEKAFTPRIRMRSTAHVLEKKLGLRGQFGPHGWIGFV